MVLPEDLVAPVDALAGNVALCPPAVAQQAGLAALSPAGMAAAREQVESYAQVRALLLQRLPELGWRHVAPADGAFYLYGDVSVDGLDSPTWCARVLDEAGVALTPGTDFDPIEVVDRAVDRIAAWRRSHTG
jgi:aspartate/methionine/tyrosine aminotransferase